MNLHSLIIDDFLSDWWSLREWADTLEYRPVTNPVDGVSYPGIYERVPTWGIKQRLQGIFQRPVLINTAFLRLSTEGMYAPHQAHHDGIMGAFTLILYMNRKEHCRGGTELVRHVSGNDLDHWQKDMNKTEKWEPYSLAHMAPNRAFIFRADLMHRSVPVVGFGSDARDGRLIYGCFFSLQ